MKLLNLKQTKEHVFNSNKPLRSIELFDVLCSLKAIRNENTEAESDTLLSSSWSLHWTVLCSFQQGSCQGDEEQLKQAPCGEGGLGRRFYFLSGINLLFFFGLVFPLTKVGEAYFLKWLVSLFAFSWLVSLLKMTKTKRFKRFFTRETDYS